MKIGLIDVDGHNFPNLPLMKLSAWHKQQGDDVEWYEPLLSGHMDKVYMSKVFSFTKDYEYFIDADKIEKGGSGYCITLAGEKEKFDKKKNIKLPHEIETIYPDYSIYYNKIPEVKETAYGFLTRGCPCDCKFCHVADKEGKCAVKVTDLNSFWKGQKNIVLLDPNITACKDWKELFKQLIDCKAWVDFSQGLRIHSITEEKAEMIRRIKVKNIHFAWDNYEEKEIVIPKLKQFKQLTKWDYRKLGVYVLCNFNTTLEQDLERIYTLRELGYSPYVMLYNKNSIPKGHKLRKMQRWVNNRIIFSNCKKFEDYNA